MKPGIHNNKDEAQLEKLQQEISQVKKNAIDNAVFGEAARILTSGGNGFDLMEVIRKYLEKKIDLSILLMTDINYEKELIEFNYVHAFGQKSSLSSLKLNEKKGLTNEVYDLQKTHYVPDVKSYSGKYVPVQDSITQKIRAFLGIPFFIENKIGGIFEVLSIEPNPFSSSDIKMLETFVRQASYFFQVQRYIQKNREADAAVRASAEQLQKVWDNSSDGFCLVDSQGRIVKANRAFARFVNIDLTRIEGNTAFDIYNPNYAKILLKNYHKMFKAGKPVNNLRDKVVLKDGSIHYVEGSRSFITDQDGRRLAFDVFRDVTEKITANRALETEKERLKVTLESIGDGVIATDEKGLITLMNNVAVHLTGWPESEAIGRDLPEVFQIVNEKNKETVENPVSLILKDGKIIGLANHTLLISKDGKEKPIADSGAPIINKTGQIIGVVLVFRDVSEKRQIEQNLIKNEKLESIGVLAGGIAHDFNNYLTAIIGNISLARLNLETNDFSAPTQKQDDKLIIRHIIAAEKAAMQAVGLTQQLLTYAKGGEPVKEVTSMAELIRESVEFSLRGSGAGYSLEIDENLDSAEVDKGQIAQVINNLVINAEQSMSGRGTISIRASNYVVTRDNPVGDLKFGHYVAVAIQDQGIGMSKEIIERIFDPYYTTKQKGSGLGMTTCYSIIRKHDGFIKVESKLGQGTTFIIYLPVTDKNIQDKRPSENIISGSGKILVMDDEEIVREVTGKMLVRVGYQVAFANDGQEACELYKKCFNTEKAFDVVILDLTVSGGQGGEETIAQMLAIDPEIKAIVASGYSTNPVMSNYKKFGFKGVLTKPYVIMEMAKLLAKLCK